MSEPEQNKRSFLRRQGTLNPRPEDVIHESFHQSEFFDREDLLQVKYEMLRLVDIENKPVSQAAKAFGFSRPSFYQAQAAFREAGLAGLLPQKRGPRSGHKLTPELMDFVAQLRAADPDISSSHLAERIAERFGVSVHPRSIDRQLLHQKKNPLSAGADSVVGNDRRLVAAYEELRSQAVKRFQQGPGMAILMTRGFRCWMEACGQILGSPSETGPQKCLESCSPVGLRGEVVVLLASILLHRASKGVV